MHYPFPSLASLENDKKRERNHRKPSCQLDGITHLQGPRPIRTINSLPPIIGYTFLVNSLPFERASYTTIYTPVSTRNQDKFTTGIIVRTIVAIHLINQNQLTTNINYVPLAPCTPGVGWLTWCPPLHSHWGWFTSRALHPAFSYAHPRTWADSVATLKTIERRGRESFMFLLCVGS